MPRASARNSSSAASTSARSQRAPSCSSLQRAARELERRAMPSSRCWAPSCRSRSSRRRSVIPCLHDPRARAAHLGRAARAARPAAARSRAPAAPPRRPPQPARARRAGGSCTIAARPGDPPSSRLGPRPDGSTDLPGRPRPTHAAACGQPQGGSPSVGSPSVRASASRTCAGTDPSRVAPRGRRPSPALPPRYRDAEEGRERPDEGTRRLEPRDRRQDAEPRSVRTA